MYFFFFFFFFFLPSFPPFFSVPLCHITAHHIATELTQFLVFCLFWIYLFFRFFVSRNGTVPKPNDDAVKLSDLYSHMPVPFKPKEWAKEERESLRQAVKELVVQRKLAQEEASRKEKRKGKGKGKEETSYLMEFYKTVENTRRGLDLSTDESRRFIKQIDWEKVAKRTLGDYEAKECEYQWRYHEDPRNQTPAFTSEEGSTLMEIAKAHDYRDWDEIAKQLGTKKRPIDCLIHVQRNRKRRINNAKQWTKEEDEVLKKNVPKYSGQWNYWQRVANDGLTNRSGTDCRQRWKRLSAPDRKEAAGASLDGNGNASGGSVGVAKEKQSKVPWTAEDDKHLLEGVKEHGHCWIKVATFVPRKNDRQCRERYHNHANPELKKSEWTEEELKELFEATVEYASGHDGEIVWEVIANKLQRSTNQCRKRWARQFQGYYVSVLRGLIKEIAEEMMPEMLKEVKKGPQKWDYQEELRMLKIVQQAYTPSTKSSKGGLVNWQKVKDNIPRNIMKCKRKIQFQQHMLFDVILEEAIKELISGIHAELSGIQK